MDTARPWCGCTIESSRRKATAFGAGLHRARREEPFDRVLFLVPLSQFKSELSQNGEAVAVGTT